MAGANVTCTVNVLPSSLRLPYQRRFGLRYGLNNRKTGSDLLRIPSHVGIAAQSSVGVALDLASHLEHHRLDDIRAEGCRDRIDRDPKFAVHDLDRLLNLGGRPPDYRSSVSSR